MRKALSFNDVLIVPNYSTIKSRNDVNISTKLWTFPYKIPVMSANMDTITGIDMANTMHNLGAAAAIHRFSSIEESVEMFKKASTAWMSIGVGENELERFQALYHSGCDQFILDIAHSGNENAVDMVKKLIPYDIKLIVGNFGSGRDVLGFFDSFSSIPENLTAIKVGVGGGSMCTTRIVTGCGLPTLQAVMEAKAALDTLTRTIPIIADGGMKTSGDVAKALAAGASMVMLGGMLAGTEETPGELIHRVEASVRFNVNLDVPFSKKYRGSASKESYEVQGKTASHRTAEGETTFVPFKGPVEDVIQQIAAGLKSAFSYVGARNLEEFQERAELVEITSHGYTESGAHGK